MAHDEHTDGDRTGDPGRGRNDDLPEGVSLNTPILIQSATDAAGLPAAAREEIDSIFDQVVTNVVLVMVDEGSTAAEMTAAAVGDATTLTG